MSKTDTHVLERHRRMAVDAMTAPGVERPEWLLGWIADGIGDPCGELDCIAQFAANIERDARAQALEEALGRCDLDSEHCACAVRIRSLLLEPPRGDACTCGPYARFDPSEHPESPHCPVHGTKGGEK